MVVIEVTVDVVAMTASRTLTTHHRLAVRVRTVLVASREAVVVIRARIAWPHWRNDVVNSNNSLWNWWVKMMHPPSPRHRTAL